MATLSIMESLFQRTLEDLIKGFCQQFISESAFISKAMMEIHREIKSTDSHTKSMALQKLSYLNVIHGVDMSWASFHAVEVMSSSRFVNKKIGYEAASQSFHEGTSVLLLITNQLRKDLSGANEFEVSLALECLSRMATVDLARDLTPELFTLLASGKVYVKKKAIGVLLRVFEKYPDAVRVCLKRLVDNLESTDMQIMTAVVGVFCELARKDPRSYLPLAPEFYKILVDSRNNWVLIKIVKIFANLAPLEPRLAKKVVEPICELMRKTGAKSLQFECIRIVVTSLSDYESAMRLAVAYIKEFLISGDSNLVYLGLQALLIVAPKQSWAVLENKEVVIKYLNNADPNIKLESLRLVMAMVSESNVSEISKVLINYATKSDPEFCNEILRFILLTCFRNVYEIINDFDWYVSLLGDMSRIPHCQQGEEIEKQLIDIGMRVKDVRPELVRVSRDLLIDPALLGNQHLHRILCGAAWVSGEYINFSTNPFELMDALVQPRTNLLQPPIRAVYIQSAFKVLIFCLHSYFFQVDTMQPSKVFSCGISDSVSQKNTEPEKCESLVDYPQDEDFNPRGTNEFGENHDVTCDRMEASNHSKWSLHTPVDYNHFTLEAMVHLLNLVQIIFGPLIDNNDVEILERTSNIISLVEMIKGENLDCLLQRVKTIQDKDVEVSNIVKIMYDAFCEELRPVSVSAQERVPVPDGLVLVENLDSLKTICGDVELTLPQTPFSLGGPLFGDKTDDSSSGLPLNEDTEPLKESTSLLSQHRNRHGLYYLPSDRNVAGSNDYPTATEPKRNSLNDDADDLVKITTRSLDLKKPNQAKPRPVVVKLDDTDAIPIFPERPEPRDGSLSGAVRDILLGSVKRPTSPQDIPHDKSSGKTKGKEKLNTNCPSKVKGNLGDAYEPDENPTRNLRRSKHHTKERRHKSPGKVVEEMEDKEQREKKSRHGHSRHKVRRRAESPLKVVSQSPVVPDFFL